MSALHRVARSLGGTVGELAAFAVAYTAMAAALAFAAYFPHSLAFLP